MQGKCEHHEDDNRTTKRPQPTRGGDPYLSGANYFLYTVRPAFFSNKMTTQIGRKLRQMLKGSPQESFWESMEQIQEALRSFYAQNGWVLTDTKTTRKLDSGHKKFEKSEKQLKKMVDKQLAKAQKHTAEQFASLHDKKLLQLQLASMREELNTLMAAKQLHDKQNANA